MLTKKIDSKYCEDCKQEKPTEEFVIMRYDFEDGMPYENEEDKCRDCYNEWVINGMTDFGCEE